MSINVKGTVELLMKTFQAYFVIEFFML